MTAVADEAAFSGLGDDGAHWRLAWEATPSRAVATAHGKTGWARVLESVAGATATVGEVVRVHLCYHNPCAARWKHASKYGWRVPLPMHVQRDAADAPGAGAVGVAAPPVAPAPAPEPAVEAIGD